ncbi:unnamed protein product [Linum trigynum]|uniref:Uncharacterized protein n=1 Tax=Linum trigynum TaxID=586398 RepID=A0AAV2EVP7_9ROSI
MSLPLLCSAAASREARLRCSILRDLSGGKEEAKNVEVAASLGSLGSILTLPRHQTFPVPTDHHRPNYFESPSFHRGSQ